MENVSSERPVIRRRDMYKFLERAGTVAHTFNVDRDASPDRHTEPAIE
jgi:hypothetical protein